MKNKKIFIFLMSFLIYIVGGINDFAIEHTYPIVGIGYDLTEESKYNSSISVYGYSGENEINSSIITAEGESVDEIKHERQLRLDKVLEVGCERVIVISSDQARDGIRPIINSLFKNSKTNDSVLMVVCKDKAVDVLNYKVKGYDSSAEYIEKIINNGETFNFASKECSLLKGYIMSESEGENLAVPYIELDSKGLIYNGMAVFNKDKMVVTVGHNESKIMNMLREKKGSGILTIQEEQGKFLNYLAKVRRKVECRKQDDKYEFVINLNFNGNILINDVYKKINKEEEKDIEEKLKKNIENMSNLFIDKMKNEFKLDCLQLGKYGAGKYGRNTGVDWNKIVCESKIKVNVRVKVNSIGRG